MKILFLILLISLRAINIYSQSELVPIDYEEFLVIEGDLDKDSIDEKVIVYTYKNKIDSNELECELVIFKKDKIKWEILDRSKNAIIGSDISDQPPLSEFSVIIKNGLLIITNGEGTGGSNTMYQTTYKFRFQNNNFELIGYSFNMMQFCRGELKYDYNISTGKFIIEDKTPNCKYNSRTGQTDENFKIVREEFFYKLKEKITLKNIFNKEVKFKSPKLKYEITFNN